MHSVSHSCCSHGRVCICAQGVNAARQRLIRMQSGNKRGTAFEVKKMTLMPIN